MLRARFARQRVKLMSDPAQFENFVLAYQDRVFSTAVRLLGNETEAEDVAQEAFVRAWNHWAYFVGFYAWKGTTLGGIVLGLKVVRLDGRKMDFACALVRTLGAMFSASKPVYHPPAATRVYMTGSSI